MVSDNLQISADAIFLPVAADRWVAYNLFAKSAVGLDGRSLATLGRAPQSDEEGEAPFRIWKIGWFANELGTLADPTRFRRDASEWGEPQDLTREELAGILLKESILVEDETRYRERFQRKRSPLDAVRFGNFHDQVGADLLLKRKSAHDWWLWQKFTADRTRVRSDNLYGAVQWNYLNRYLPEKIKPGMRVLDLGCGTGIYSRLMAESGARVVGVDPGENYLEIARTRFGDKGIEFAQAQVGQPGALDFLEGNSFDAVFMSDALLFYFVKVALKDQSDIQILLADILRLLKVSGTFISVEPHPVFYLAPWLGEEAHPFTAVTEYRNRNFSTTPNFSQTIQSLSRAGFLLSWMDELYLTGEAPEVESRATKFASEYPLWTLFEFVKRPAAQ